jgi:dipeptidyl aminopeptidase
LLVVTAFAAVIGGFSASHFTAPTYYKKSGRQHITMDHIFNGTFYAQSKQLNWVPEGKP